MEKPILFNTEMVKAILEGRKTVTRRAIKLPKHVEEQENGLYTLYAEGGAYIDASFETVKDYINSPCKVGDILYVRETWTTIDNFKNYADVEMDEDIKYLYKCDDNGKEHVFIDIGVKRWKPSIQMPKTAARIFLEVTDVRVERLQDITEEQSIKEGCSGISCEKPHNYNSDECCGYCNNSGYIEPPQLEFLYLWNNTLNNEQLGLYGWDANPWVWVIEFKVKEVKN